MPITAPELPTYFAGFDDLTDDQKAYVASCLDIWIASGLLSVVVNRGKQAEMFATPEDRYERATSYRTLVEERRASGHVVFDSKELERDMAGFQKFGPLASSRPMLSNAKMIEVRGNMCVSHEFGHQLLDILSFSAKERLQSFYKARLDRCNKVHPLLEGYSGNSELVALEQANERVFITGYSRSEPYEYFAEAVGAFSFKQSREQLKVIDPEIYQFLCDLIHKSEGMFDPTWQDAVSSAQIQQRASGALTDDLLNRHDT